MVGGGWGGGGESLLFCVTRWGSPIHVCCSNFFCLKRKFSIPVKSLCCVSVQCIVVVMWDSAQCYSVVCGEDSYYLHLQYSFLKILLQKTRALKQIGHRVHSSQSVRYVLFQSRGELPKTTSWVSAK